MSCTKTGRKLDRNDFKNVFRFVKTEGPKVDSIEQQNGQETAKKTKILTKKSHQKQKKSNYQLALWFVNVPGLKINEWLMSRVH